ncbi:MULTISPECIES: flagellar biosynthesis anti-sigma factor FlgM [Neptuniibacter]|jgi:negative regulator of flagellin synthesis FlgM|uniref:flagellar biosynthesis anti-sigma factor FlgM n=1 Tax=Neptuniibacter TaxID=459520 RepID=UPI00082DF092|nr:MULTISPECIES: flagellar biosynthesis anti-sigma factor FlgM [Neptuniibacter]MDO6515451.1 flagellar biosynthesis anti-sigma factor FlgM [Neptuniibacter sp. 2_MG-2023]MDO6595086.1 flagellar biosynthesis anti-sigma factor FlgM [Neptuniibacter sp. 1_MG-2023]
MINDLTSLSSSQTASTRARTNEQGNAAKNGNGAVAQQPPSNKGDTVNLSNAAQLLQNVDKQLSDTPDVDNERVERIKQEIESGSYQINAERVAEKMLNFDNLL